MPIADRLEGPAMERRWNQLLDLIEVGLVVPIVGRELLWTQIDDARQYVPAYLARQLASRASLEGVDDSGPDPVSRVVQTYLLSPDSNRTWPYTALSQLTKELNTTEPPAPLVKLAEIPFRLFVSTTSDNYLERALNAVRFEGHPNTVVPRYGMGSNVDLAERGHQETTTVFPLLGAANPAADYALTEEDVLEFVHQFQVTGTPRRLFDTLRQSHLLLIGGGFPDWLARFMVRLAKPGRLWTSSTHQLTMYVADRTVTDDPRLMAFLGHPLSDTQVFPLHHAEQFVDELHRRWTVRHGPFKPDQLKAVEAPIDDSVREGGIFLSYCSEDYERAVRIKDTLERAGLDVWFDKRNLEAGDEFERKIIGQICRSYLFVAVISRAALTREHRFFHLEWREAEARARYAAFDVPYVLPLVLDDTPVHDERFPPFLRKVQWTRAAGGDVPPEFVQTLKHAYRQVQRSAPQS